LKVCYSIYYSDLKQFVYCHAALKRVKLSKPTNYNNLMLKSEKVHSVNQLIWILTFRSLARCIAFLIMWCNVSRRKVL